MPLSVEPAYCAISSRLVASHWGVYHLQEGPQKYMWVSLYLLCVWEVRMDEKRRQVVSDVKSTIWSQISSEILLVYCHRATLWIVKRPQCSSDGYGTITVCDQEHIEPKPPKLASVIWQCSLNKPSSYSKNRRSYVYSCTDVYTQCPLMSIVYWVPKLHQ